MFTRIRRNREACYRLFACMYAKLFRIKSRFRRQILTLTRSLTRLIYDRFLNELWRLIKILMPFLNFFFLPAVSLVSGAWLQLLLISLTCSFGRYYKELGRFHCQSVMIGLIILQFISHFMSHSRQMCQNFKWDLWPTW